MVKDSTILKCILPIVFGVAIPLCIIEISLRLSYGALPISLIKYLPTDVRILAQGSKDGQVPSEYIALLGDSYAAGWGDWYLSALDSGPFEKPAYHSAHVISSNIGVDVLSFAQPAFGSFDGIAYYPARYLKMLRKRGFELGTPSDIVVYFYEGNDLADNINFLDRYWANRPEEFTKEDLQPVFQDALEQVPMNRRSIIGRLKHSEIMNASYALKFFYILAQDLGRWAQRVFDAQDADGIFVSLPEDRQTTFIRVNGKDMKLPVALETPALNLDNEEIESAFLVLELSLEYLTQYFQGARFTIVYLPAPISSYEIASDSVQVYMETATVSMYPTESIIPRSDMLCERVSQIACNVGAAFLDTRPDLSMRSRQVESRSALGRRSRFTWFAAGLAGIRFHKSLLRHSEKGMQWSISKRLSSRPVQTQ